MKRTRVNQEERDQLIADVRSEIRNDISEIKVPLANRIAIWAGLLVSIITLGTVLTNEGRRNAQLDRVLTDHAALNARVNTIEVTATAGAREYIARDTARADALDQRIKRVEDALEKIGLIQADIAVLKNTLLSGGMHSPQKTP